MGLDMTICREVRENTREELLNELEGKKKIVEVVRWRKFWELQTAIGDILGENIENCEGYELSKDNVEAIIDWLEQNKQNGEIYKGDRDNIDGDIEMLNEILDETDFDVYKLIYEGWW